MSDRRTERTEYHQSLTKVAKPGEISTKPGPRAAKFSIGSVVRHKFLSFRGIIFDVDPEFANTEEWWLAIPPEIRPKKNQPFYHLLAENEDGPYTAYVSEQNLLPDMDGEDIEHPQITMFFEGRQDNQFVLKPAFFH
jgi:heat shock protein HspQ